MKETRTSPVDHKAKAQEKANLYLQATSNGQGRAFSLLDNELSLSESQGKRNDELRKVIDDAKRLTEMPEDFEQYLNYYRNKFLWALADTNTEE